MLDGGLWAKFEEKDPFLRIYTCLDPEILMVLAFYIGETTDTCLDYF